MSEMATVRMDEHGRVTIPKPVRESLGIDGEEALVQIEIELTRGIDRID